MERAMERAIERAMERAIESRHERPRALATPELSPRLERVLRAVIETYVETARPVASGPLVTRSGLGISPATARGIMAELGALGLLSQAHPSAGRVPTDLGFRYHADAILRSLEARAPSDLGLEFDLDRTRNPTDLLRQAADQLSLATGQLSFFLTSPPDPQVLCEVHLTRLSSERVIALLVSQRGLVQSRIIVDRDTPPAALERISARLCDLITGRTLAEARERLERAIEADRSEGDRLWTQLLALSWVNLEAPAEVALYVGDRAPLFDQPEFADVQRLRDLLSALEEKERMAHLLDAVIRAEAFEVQIGSEIADPDICSCAVVAAPLGGSPALGGLGILGPVRMEYGRVIPLVRSLSHAVNRHLA